MWVRYSLVFQTFFLIILLALLSASTFGQKKSQRFDPDGTFWIQGTPPSEFQDFSAINLNARRNRRLSSPGVQLSVGTTFRFRLLSVRRDNFRFTTFPIDGVSYGFAGHFLKGGVFYAAAFDEDAPVLEGVLTKYKFGKKVAEAKLKFTYFGGT